MIAKRVKKVGSSSFRNLSRYVRDLKAEGEKVRDAWASNCADEEDLDLAEIEIEATQALNTRTKADKTYHLVISLAPGEDLTSAQWREVEENFCKAIGLSDHQRIAAVHTDTDSIHMHLAISKIHPSKLTAIEPYYDKYKLQDGCRELERKFGLKAGISPEKDKKRQNVEAFQKIQSFESYVKDAAAESLRSVLQADNLSWQKVQEELGRYNLEIRERGAGLVISHREKPLFVKASAIDRSFSKQTLEGKLGVFERSLWQGTPEKSYIPAPTGRSEASSGLYSEYLRDKEIREQGRGEIRGKQKQDLQSKLDEIKNRYSERRDEIKRDTLVARGHKRAIYQKLSAHMKAEISEVYSEDKAEREQLREIHGYKPWQEWIYEKANAGDETALGALRAGAKSRPDPEGAIEFRGERNDKIFEGIPKVLLRDGTIEYRMSEGVFVDVGNAIFVKSSDPRVIEVAERCAEVKFGSSMIAGIQKEKVQVKSAQKQKEIEL